jgi:hypothetical protein
MGGGVGWEWGSARVPVPGGPLASPSPLPAPRAPTLVARLQRFLPFCSWSPALRWLIGAVLHRSAEWKEREKVKHIDPAELVERYGLTFIPTAYTKDAVRDGWTGGAPSRGALPFFQRSPTHPPSGVNGDELARTRACSAVVPGPASRVSSSLPWYSPYVLAV